MGDAVLPADLVRCVSVPLDRCLGRVPNPRRPADVEPAEFWPALHAAWRLSTDLANWGVGELLRRDVRRTPDMTRLPAMPAVNLYTHWNATAPAGLRRPFDGAAGSAASVIRWVHRKYRQDRYRVVWQGAAAHASYRYPYPWPVRAQEVRLAHAGGEWRVSLTLPGGRLAYSLRRGPGFERQARDLAVLLADPDRLGEVRLCPRYSGGRVVGCVARFAGSFPRPDPRAGGVARVETAPDRLLVATVPGRREPFALNLDHVPQLLRGADRLRRRLAEDTKHEKRWPAWKRRRFLRVAETRSQVRRDRVRTALQQAAAAVVGFAARQGCGAVEYDDAERTYLLDPADPDRDLGPWCELRAAVSFAAAKAGIEFHPVGGHEDAAA